MPKIITKKIAAVVKPEQSVETTEENTPEVKPSKCKAKEVGHSACKCGGNYCGDNVTG